MTIREWFNIFCSLGYVLFTATTSTLTLLVPAIVLRLISTSLYSRVTSGIFACWWTSCLFITETLNGIKVRVTGDALPDGVPLLFMSNHKCNLDWMFLWSAAIRTGSLWNVGLFRAVAKAEIRVIPIFGWGCKLNGFAYVKRRWDRDKAHMTRWIRAQIARAASGWVLIFPEGTRYTDANKKRIAASCEKRGVTPLPGEILQPRTKGLALLLAESKAAAGFEDTGGYFGGVVDMTVAYTDANGVPLSGSALGTRCFGQLMKGHIPVHTCHVHFKCFAPSEVPAGVEEIDAWCLERWREKAKLLEGIAKDGRVLGTQPWSTSGGRVPPVLQGLLRVGFVSQGLVCVALLVSYKAFALYALCALVGVGIVAHVDQAEW